MSTFTSGSGTIHFNRQYTFQWEEAQQCYVVLFPEGLVKLGGSAAEILKRCQQPITVNELVTDLQNTFSDADAAELEQDVLAFLAQAEKENWLRIQV